MKTNEVSLLAGQVIAEVEKAIVGKQEVLRVILAALITPGGHILLEDYPGLAKTLIAKSFAAVLGLSFKRIQFTPDLLPGDITGGYVFDRNQNQFSLRQGPLFANLILADEINRASPRTQSALLEAMQEYQVTLEGETLPLPEPFLVLATQNPIEYEGTFPLPEAQLDRFLMKLSVGYPTLEDEKQILQRRQDRQSDAFELCQILDLPTFLEIRQAVEKIYVDPDLEEYMARLVGETRNHRKVAVGASPRGTLALLKIARSWAAIQGRAYVLPDDVKRFAQLVLAHRLVMVPDLWTDRRAGKAVVEEILQRVPVPVVKE